MQKTWAIIGGGAAGFFGAIRLAALSPQDRVVILEKSSQVLAKVKISGGGRCNVTHQCFDPRVLVKNYPRGFKELLGPFHKFQPGDILEWFNLRGIELKTEDDGRIFPVSDRSQTIIDCFEDEARRLGVEVWMKCGVDALTPAENQQWQVHLQNGRTLMADGVLITTGSSGQMWRMLSNLGHTIVDPVPSLFTFRIADNRLKDLAGVSVSHGEARIEGTKHAHEGPLLITHHGLSGPGILKLSAWAARELAEVNYNFTIRVNWDARFDKESAIDYLIDFKQEHARKQVKTYSPFKMPHRLWVALVQSLGTLADATWSSISLKQLDVIAEAAVRSYFDVSGKNTFKDEFVTAGGIELKEVDFKTMQSKRLPGIFFAGEVLNIDAVTGGFNFQAAWTTSWIAAAGMANRDE